MLPVHGRQRRIPPSYNGHPRQTRILRTHTRRETPPTPHAPLSTLTTTEKYPTSLPSSLTTATHSLIRRIFISQYTCSTWNTLQQLSTPYHTRTASRERDHIWKRGAVPSSPRTPPRLFRKPVTERGLGNFFSVNPPLCSLRVCNEAGRRRWQRAAGGSQRCPEVNEPWPKGGAVLHGFLRSGSSFVGIVRQTVLRPVCGVYYLVSCWRSLRVVRALVRSGRTVQWRLRKRGDRWAQGVILHSGGLAGAEKLARQRERALGT